MSNPGSSPGSPVRVLLIEDNPGDAELVQEMLREAGDAGFELHHARALLPGLDRLAKSDIDLVLLDLSLPDSRGLDALNALRTHAPAIPTVLLTGMDNDSMALRAMQCGAQDYLVKGKLDSAALVRTLRYAVVRQKNQLETTKVEPSAEPGRIIGLIGAKGGVGTTIIACHLAQELKRLRRDDSVLLCDLDLSGSTIGFLTKSPSKYSILDAANSLLRLDVACWEKMLHVGPDGLEIMRSPGPLISEDTLKPDRIRYVLRFARSIYRWLFLDLGRLSPTPVSLLPDVGELILVAGPDVPALFEARQAVEQLRRHGFQMERVRLVLNREPRRFYLDTKELEKLIGIPVDATLPECAAELNEAYGEGTLLEDASALRRQIGRLAGRLAGIEPKPVERRFTIFSRPSKSSPPATPELESA